MNPRSRMKASGGLVRRVLHQGHGVLGQARPSRRPGEASATTARLESMADDEPRRKAAFPALRHSPAASLVTFGPVLVDHPDDAERHPHPRHPQAVRPHPALGDLSDGVGQGRPPCAGRPPWPPTRSSVRRSRSRAASTMPAASARSQVGPIGLDQRRPLLLQEVGREPERVVAHRARRPRHHPGRRPDAARELLQCGRGHRVRLQAPGRRGGRRPGCAGPSTPRRGRRAPGPGPWRRPRRPGPRSRPLPRAGSRRDGR